MSNSFQVFSAKYKPRIDIELSQICKRLPDQSDLTVELQRLITRGGKRLRPLLCLLAYQGYGGHISTEIMPEALSQELLHTYLLIHDDIIDRDTQRWGGPNIIGVYFERYSKTMTAGDAWHYATTQALLAGDMAAALAGQLLESPAVQRLQQRMVQQVLAGERQDVTNSLSTSTPTAADVLTMYERKTASYTFALPLQTGALLSGAADSELALLNELATSLGLAYQLQDDLLGMFGDESRTGKSSLSDLREGKRTFLVITALWQACRADKKQLLALLGKADVTNDDLQTAQRIIRASGAYDVTLERITTYSQAVEVILQRSELSLPARQQLTDLTALLQARQQ